MQHNAVESSCAFLLLWKFLNIPLQPVVTRSKQSFYRNVSRLFQHHCFWKAILSFCHPSLLCTYLWQQWSKCEISAESIFEANGTGSRRQGWKQTFQTIPSGTTKGTLSSTIDLTSRKYLIEIPSHFSRPGGSNKALTCLRRRSWPESCYRTKFSLGPNFLLDQISTRNHPPAGQGQIVYAWLLYLVLRDDPQDQIVCFFKHCSNGL